MNVDTFDAKPLHEEVLNLSKEAKVGPIVNKDIVLDAIGSMDFSKVVVGEYGRGHHREIRYNPITRWFLITDHGDTVHATGFASVAADMYNSIQPH